MSSGRVLLHYRCLGFGFSGGHRLQHLAGEGSSVMVVICIERIMNDE